VAREAKVCPDDVGEKGKRALPRLEVTHQGHERVAFLDDLKKVLVDIDCVTAGCHIAVDVDHPAIGREAKLPLAGGWCSFGQRFTGLWRKVGALRGMVRSKPPAKSQRCS
jgi:hypothetical protein